MNCYKCGHEVPDGQEYCQFCGLKLEKKKMQGVIDEIMGYDENNPNEKEQIRTSKSSDQVDSDSTIGSAIKVFSVTVLIVSLIGAIVLAGKLGASVSLALGAVDLLICMLCYGIGEICCLLKSIDAKLK